MAKRPAAWQALLDLPVPKSVPRMAGKLTREEKEYITRAMWAALDGGDLPALERALVDGASATHRRGGRQPLWEAVFRQQWEAAELLLAHGAGVNDKTASGQSLWGAIAMRDNPKEAARLLKMGVRSQCGKSAGIH